MKVNLLLILIAFSLTSFGQEAPGKQLPKITASSKITVFHEKGDSISALSKTKYFINNVSYGDLTPIFNSESIKDINVETKGSKILITLDSEYKPNFITLNQLKQKYIDSKGKPAIYILEGSLIKNDLQLIDENYVLSIKVSGSTNLTYLKDNVKDFDIISISLKTKANLEKANTIYIRGNDDVGK